MLLHSKERVAEYVATGAWGAETWDSLLWSWASERAERLAVVDPPNRRSLVGGEPRRLSWLELDEEVDRVAGVLVFEGVRVGHVVGLQMTNGVDLVATLLALARLRAIAMPLPVQFGTYEVIRMGRSASMRALVTEARRGGRAPAEDALALLGEIATLERVFAWGEGGPRGAVALEGAAAPSPPHPGEASPNECVTVCWTSGTESAPKGVPRCHGDWLAMARLSVDAAELGAEDVLLNPFPMVNMAGIGGMLLPWLLCGGTLVQHHPFDLAVFLAQIAAERVTYTVAAPAILNRLLLDEEAAGSAELSSVRSIASGSAPLAPWMVAGYRERFGIEVLNYFASNEGVALMSDARMVPDPAQRAAYFPRRPARPEGTSTRLVDLATGEEIEEPGRAGELRIRGPAVFAGYLNAEELTNPFDEHGYFCTGDVFEIAGSRGEFYRYVDRAKDIIVRGGMNISAAEVEGHLQSHPGILEVAALAVPDRALGERVCAVVVPSAGAEPPTLEELADHLRELGVARYKRPEHLAVLDALPRNAVGKVLKRELGERLARARSETTG